MDRLEDLREEQRTPIGTAVSVLLFAADGPVATELFSDLAAMAIPYEATAMIGDIHYLAAADGNQMSAVGIYTGGPGRSWPIHPDEPMAPWNTNRLRQYEWHRGFLDRLREATGRVRA